MIETGYLFRPFERQESHVSFDKPALSNHGEREREHFPGAWRTRREPKPNRFAPALARGSSNTWVFSRALPQPRHGYPNALGRMIHDPCVVLKPSWLGEARPFLFVCFGAPTCSFWSSQWQSESNEPCAPESKREPKRLQFLKRGGSHGNYKQRVCLFPENGLHSSPVPSKRPPGCGFHKLDTSQTWVISDF